MHCIDGNVKVESDQLLGCTLDCSEDGAVTSQCPAYHP